MLNKLNRLLISSEGRSKFLNGLILLSLITIISCNNNGNGQRNTSLLLDDLFLSNQLSSDVEYFIKLNDSIDIIRGQGRTSNAIKNNVYVFCFFKCNGFDIVTIDLLSFYNKVIPPGDEYLGYYFYLDKYFIFYQDKSTLSLVNSDLLDKNYPDSVPDEYSKEAVLTSNGGDCRSLVYKILPDSQIVLISQNPVNYIRKLDIDTIVFPCNDY